MLIFMYERLSLKTTINLVFFYKTRCLGTLQFWEKRRFEGAASSVSPIHILK